MRFSARALIVSSMDTDTANELAEQTHRALRDQIKIARAGGDAKKVAQLREALDHVGRALDVLCFL